MALTLTPACAGFGSYVDDYGAQKLTIDAERDELLVAAQQHVDAQGWTTVKSGKNQVVAVTEVDASGGMVTRDKWRFGVRNGAITAQLFLESKEHGRWVSQSVVSSNYSYFREHEHLRQISERTLANRNAGEATEPVQTMESTETTVEVETVESASLAVR